MPKQQKKRGRSSVGKGSLSPKHLKVKSSPKKLSDEPLEKKNEDDDKLPNIAMSDNKGPGKRGIKRKSSGLETELLHVDDTVSLKLSAKEKRHKITLSDRRESENTPTPKSQGKKIEKKSANFQTAKSKKVTIPAMEPDDQSIESEINIPSPTKHNLEEAVLAVVQAAAQAKKHGHPLGKGKPGRGRPSKVKLNVPQTEVILNASPQRGRPKTKIGGVIKVDTAKILTVKPGWSSKNATPKVKSNDPQTEVILNASPQRGRPKTKIGDTAKVLAVKPGRPFKNATHKRGRPQKSTGNAIVVKKHSNKPGRPSLKIINDAEGIVAHHHKRGRPAKGANPSKRGRPSLKMSNGPEGDVAHHKPGRPSLKVSGGKRGRPKGIKGSAHKAVRPSGQPHHLGRPAKIKPEDSVKAIHLVIKSAGKRGRPRKVTKTGFGLQRGRPPKAKMIEELKT